MIDPSITPTVCSYTCMIKSIVVQSDYVFNERYGGWNKRRRMRDYFFLLIRRSLTLTQPKSAFQKKINKKTKSKQNG